MVKLKIGVIIYSLGDLISSNDTTSIILTLKLTKHIDNSISIDTVKYTPIYTYKNENATSLQYEILDINKSISEYLNETDSVISKDLYNTLTQAKSELKDILEN